MKIKSINCPNCGSSVDLDFEHLAKFCQYCGAKLLLDMDNVAEYLAAKEKTKQVQIKEDSNERIKKVQADAYVKAKQSEANAKIEVAKTRKSIFERPGCIAAIVICGIGPIYIIALILAFLANIFLW